MTNFHADQRYRVSFFPDNNLTADEIDRGKREAARQLHAIGEYPWPGLPSDVQVSADYVNHWKTGENGRAELICESYAHAVEVDTFLGIVEGFNVDMEPYDGE